VLDVSGRVQLLLRAARRNRGREAAQLDADDEGLVGVGDPPHRSGESGRTVAVRHEAARRRGEDEVGADARQVESMAAGVATPRGILNRPYGTVLGVLGTAIAEVDVRPAGAERKGRL